MEMGKIREGGWPSLMVFGRSGVDRFSGKVSVDEGGFKACACYWRACAIMHKLS
jgi:hypothetical protein